jgi:hypothetical protein
MARFVVDGEELKNDPADPNGAHWRNDNPSAVRMQAAATICDSRLVKGVQKAAMAHIDERLNMVATALASR